MLRTGDLVADFELLGVLGRGGFGTVWEARSPRHSKTVALKVLHPTLWEADGGGPSMVDRFLGEARILQSLTHPGLVKLLEVIDQREQKTVAFAMEKLVGRDLGTLAPTLPLASLVAILARVAEILEFLHQNNVLHRDVKLSNVFILDQDSPEPIKLIDLGIAKSLTADKDTRTGVIFGTLRSMAPETIERLSGLPVDLSGAVDQWSVGILLYTLLSGRVPFSSGSLFAVMRAIRDAELPPLTPEPRFLDDPILPQTRAVMERCLARRPEDRFESMAELAAALRVLAPRATTLTLELDELVAVLAAAQATTIEPSHTIDSIDNSRPTHPEKDTDETSSNLDSTDFDATTELGENSAAELQIPFLTTAPSEPAPTRLTTAATLPSRDGITDARIPTPLPRGDTVLVEPAAPALAKPQPAKTAFPLALGAVLIALVAFLMGWLVGKQS